MDKDKLEFVSAIITNNEGNVLLLKRKNDLVLDPKKYDLCSGHMKEGEVPMQSIYREIYEKLGIKQEEIGKVEKIEDIPTPHKDFKGTICHIYHVEIDLTGKEINNRLKTLENTDIQSAQYIESIGMLRKIQKYTNLMRTEHTDEQDMIFKIMQEKENKKEEIRVYKEQGKESELCQEER